MIHGDKYQYTEKKLGDLCLLRLTSYKMTALQERCKSSEEFITHLEELQRKKDERINEVRDAK